jgi:large subunit ribosomal protein L44e
MIRSSMSVYFSSQLIYNQVNVPKTRRTYCPSKKCGKHTLHKVSQYKTGKPSLFAQGTYTISFLISSHGIDRLLLLRGKK